MIPKDKVYLPEIDGLRGIAILLVILFHLFNFGIFKDWFHYGWMGVDLFFVISGFLITRILLHTRDNKDYLKTFFTNRILRILPLYFGTLVAVNLIAPWFEQTKWFTGKQLYFWTFTANILILRNDPIRPLFHFWSLILEEQFYLVWPFVVFFFNRKTLMFLCGLLMVTAVICRYKINLLHDVHGLLPAHMDGLVTGALIACVQQCSYPVTRRTAVIICACMSLAFALYMGIVPVYISQRGQFLRHPFTITMISLFFGSLLFLTLHDSFVKKILSNRLLLFFARYSYGMYIFNFIFLYLAHFAGMGTLPPNQQLLCGIGLFFLTVIVSYLSYTYYESRFLKMKRRYTAVSPYTASDTAV